jgi:tetratricopeptide (TPR) repeat protein
MRRRGDIGLLAVLMLLTGCTRPAAETFKWKAERELERGAYSAALGSFNAAVQLDPKLPGIYYERGVARLKLDDYEGALRDFERQINVASGYFGGYYGRGLVERQKHQYDSAFSDFNEAIRLNPRFGAPYGERGAVKQAKGDLHGAIADYDRCLALSSSKQFTIIRARGAVKYLLREYSAAIGDFTEAIEIQPRDVTSYVDRGWVRYLQKDNSGAIADYSTAIAIDPKGLSAYGDRALARFEKGDYEGAIVDATKGITDDPKSPEQYMWRAILESSHGKYKAAVDDGLEAVKLDSKAATDSSYGLFLLWLAYIDQSDFGPREAELSHCVDLSAVASQNDWSSKIVGFLLGRISEADLLAAAASSDGEMNRARHCQAWCYAGMRRLNDGDEITAIDYFERSVGTVEDTLAEYLLCRLQLGSLEKR